MNHKQDLEYCEQDNALSPTRIELCGESAVARTLGLCFVSRLLKAFIKPRVF